MTRDRTRPAAGASDRAVGDVDARTSAQAPSHGPDPVQEPEGYARTVLHHAVTHGDLLEECADGTVTIVLTLPRREFDRLNAFDPDGDGDREPVRVAAENSPV